MITLLFGLLLGLSDFDLARESYEEARYGEALALFQDAEAQPGPVLYNMGNCAYRLGRFGEAILYYRCALLRLPDDHEVKFNLALAEQRLGLDTPLRVSFGTAIVEWIDSFTPRRLLVLIGWLQGFGLLGFVLFRRNRMMRNVMFLVVVLSLTGAGRLVHNVWFPGPPEGVVISDEIELRSEPHTDLAVMYTLSAGETVRVEEGSDRWVRVVHSRGGGWTECSGVGIVE